MKYKFFLAILILLMSYSVRANQFTDLKLSEKAQISIITCGTGDQLYSLFGHTALRVYDPFERIDRVYNYGLFDFRVANFYGKFVKGDLLYFVDYDSYRDFLTHYVYDQRAVYEQVLDLDSLQKQAVFNQLNESLLEENKFYTYKFIDQNCTTKVVDIVNSVLPTPVKVDVKGNTDSYRSVLNTYLESRYFEMLGINLIFGAKVNKEVDLLFLPDKFMLGLAETQINGKPLVAETINVYVPQSTSKGTWWNTMWFASILFVLLAVSFSNATIRKCYLMLLGLLGLFFIGVGVYSLHAELLWNNTVLLCSPLFLLIPFVKSTTKWRGTFNILLLLSVLGYVVVNLMSQKLLVSIPLVLITLLAVLLETKIIGIPRKKMN